jgi:hypothetical protein
MKKGNWSLLTRSNHCSEKGERHRLIGLENWGVVAEFWQHTDPEHPSDEDDIVRVQDDYKRSTPA